LGAVTGYQTFSSAIGNANTCYYTIADQNGANWEVGIGTYTSSGNTLTRTTVLSSSNGGATTNFTSGTQNVFVTYPSERSVNLSSSALTSGRVTYATTDGLLTDSANFTWNGSSLGLTGTTSAVTTAITATTGAPYTSYTNTGSSFFVGKENSAGGSFGTTAYASLLYEGGAYPMVFFTNATERMRITSAGNVGIGTSSPSFGLIVEKDNGSGYVAGFRSASGSPMLTIQNTGGISQIQGLNSALSAVANIGLQISGGNVGIGTSSPAAILDVNTASSSIRFGDKTTVGNDISIYYRTTGIARTDVGSGGNFTWGISGGSELMRIDSSGNLSVGTTTASYSAASRGNITIGGTTSAILGFQVGGVAKGYVFLDSSLNYQLWNESATSMLFGTNATERMRITSGGSVLIGQTTAPSSGTGLTTNGVQYNYSTAGGGLIQTPNGTGLSFYTYTGVMGSETYTRRMDINSSGNVGIGTSSPGAPLSFADTTALKIQFNGNAANYYGISKLAGSGNLSDGEFRLTSGATSSGGFTFFGSSEFMRIDSSGNVIVGGTSTLGAKFAVIGTASGSNNYLQITNPGIGTATLGLTASSSNVKLYNSYTSGTLSTGAGIDIDTSGNLGVGITSVGARIQVQGAGATSATYCGSFLNSGGFPLLDIRNDGLISTGSRSLSPYNNTTASASNMYVDSSGLLYRSTSSLKYKTDVQDATHGLTDVLKLRSVTYKGNNDGDTVFGGLIAEEVHEAGLTEFVQYAEDGTPDALAYGNMVSLAFKAIQEQQALIESLTTRLTALENK
jgi:hypothetical protein